MSASLESRYRRLLGWYPRSWRRHHGEAFLGTLLDVAESEGRDEPTAGERTSIASHGIEARLDRLVAPEVRLAGSTIALAMGAGVSWAEFVMSSWAPWHSPATPGAWSPARIDGFYDTGFVFAVLWTVAVVAALAGRWWLGRAALTASLIAVVATPHLTAGAGALQSVDGATLTLLACCALVALPARPRPGLPTLGAAAGFGLLATLAALSSDAPAGSWLPSSSLWSQVGALWYAAMLVLVVALGLAIARYWTAAFTLVMGLTPLAATFVVNEARGAVIENGSAALVSVPVGVGLLLLVLHSSGLLRLPIRRGPRRSTFGSVAAVVLLAGMIAGSPVFFASQGGQDAVPARIALAPFTIDSPRAPSTPFSGSTIIDTTRPTVVTVDGATGRVLSVSPAAP